MGRRDNIHIFQEIPDFSILRSEEQEMYKFMYERNLVTQKVDEIELELKNLKNRLKELSDPGIGKSLGISKQAVFVRRINLINKINRICLKNK